MREKFLSANQLVDSSFKGHPDRVNIGDLVLNSDQAVQFRSVSYHGLPDQNGKSYCWTTHQLKDGRMACMFLYDGQNTLQVFITTNRLNYLR
jgi:hypothetical protein